MQIYEAISNVMADIGAIGKDKRNSQQNFNYRGVDDVMNALQPCLVKHKIFVAPEVLEYTREERQTKTGGNLVYTIMKIRYTFYAADGTAISATVIGEAMDSADKSSNKAMSVAFKYACFQVFCIPTEEMIDPDADTYFVDTKNKSEADITPPEKQVIKGNKNKSNNPLKGNDHLALEEKELKPVDVFDLPGAANVDNKTLFINALKIAKLTNEQGAEILNGMFGKDTKVNELSAEDFRTLISVLE